MVVSEAMFWKFLATLGAIGIVCVTLTAVYVIRTVTKPRLGELERLDQDVIDELIYYWKCMKIKEGIEMKHLARYLK